MPVQNKKTTKQAVVKNKETKTTNNNFLCVCSNPYQMAMRKILITLITFLIIYMIVYLGTLIRNEILESRIIGMAPRLPGTITVSGLGQVPTDFDSLSGVFNISVVGDDATVAKEAGEKYIAEFQERLRGVGVSIEDIEVKSYGVNPSDIYADAKDVLLYSSDYDVKVIWRSRDVSPELLRLGEEETVRNFTGLKPKFNSSKEEKALARDEALQDVQEKASDLSRVLGVKFVRIVGYYEDEGIYDSHNFNDELPDEVSVRVHMTFEVE